MNCYARIVKAAVITSFGVAGLTVILAARQDVQNTYAHVLLLSIDGLHAFDLKTYVRNNPGSALAQLSAHGRTYTHASATKPSDSFPGMLAMVTGGTPRSTGVYYDDGWDRTLAGASGTCTPGTRARWKQNLDFTPVKFTTFSDFSAFWSGPAATTPIGWPLNVLLLPRTPADACLTARVYPHQFPRVNNVFELIKAADRRNITAWSDKHPAYEFLKGPSGTGIDDLYTPEIATSIGTAPAPLTSSLTALITDNFELTRRYDDLKVAAILNQINGLDHTGTNAVGVPTLFGMNFQAVSVGQKLDMSSIGGLKGGYLDKDGTPSDALQTALAHTDESIGRMVSALQAQGLLDSTLVIISAKHGNSPVDPTLLARIDPVVINNTVNSVAAGLAALVSADTGPLIWLKDQSKTAAVVAAIDANRAALNLTSGPEAILWGPDLAALYPDPLTDARTPDIILSPKPGTVYVAPVLISGAPMWTKIADHGSFYDDDVRVGLLVSNPRFATEVVDTPVETRQIACTILVALGLDCAKLDAQQVEPSTFLPHDMTPPVLALPPPIVTEATGPAGATVTFDVTASDPDDAAGPVTCAPASGSVFTIGTTVVTCNSADTHGNTGTDAFTVTVSDTAPPSLTLPANITTDATDPSGAVVAYQATAVDVVDGAVAVTCSPASGSTFAMGTTAVNCSATDNQGNSATGSFSVVVLTPVQIVTNLLARTMDDQFADGSALLENVLASLNAGKTATACNQLNAFINKVQAQWDKSLTIVEATYLITLARDAMGALGYNVQNLSNVTLLLQSKDKNH